MKKHVILLTDANTAPERELVEILNSAGTAVWVQSLNGGLDFTPESTLPFAIIYPLADRANSEELQLIVDRVGQAWPGVAIVGCRSQSLGFAAGTSFKLDNQSLQRLGFRAIADSPAQLPAVLRQIEDVVGTGELKLPQEFRSTPSNDSFAFHGSLRPRHLRSAFALLASLHFAADQKEAARATIVGVARLVVAERWSIFLTLQTSVADAMRFEPLASGSFSDCGARARDWQPESLNDLGAQMPTESKAAQEAALKVQTIRRTETKNRVIALPLVSEERVQGVLEGVRDSADARAFSRSEARLLEALTIPIASALSNSARVAEAERLSLTDDLTRLHNARYLRQFLVNEIKRARRYKSSVAALFLDLDDFKRVNDLHGHLAGSHVLMEVAAIVLPSVRDTDCVVRYGGDEFVVILPEAGIDDALQVAERIRLKIERHQFTGGRHLNISLTASLGLAVFPLHALSPQQLIAYADRAMYQAKAAQKNCVRVAVESAEVDRDGARNSAIFGPSQFQRIPDEKLIS